MDEQSADPGFAEPVEGVGRWRRLRDLVVVAVCAVLVAGALLAVGRLVGDDGGVPTSGSGGHVVARPAGSGGGPLEVSGTGVGGQRFGTDADEVVAAVSARLGKPDVTMAPQRYARIPGNRGWFEDGDDPLSPSWRHRVVSVRCWQALCLVFGGAAPDALRLRGWELADHPRWAEQSELEQPDLMGPDVRLAGSGVRLGDSWTTLHAAYPDTVVTGAEGASVAVGRAPWAGVSDGAAAWRLSGQWDYTHPHRAPSDAVVVRLSGGDGPEPGCC